MSAAGNRLLFAWLEVTGLCNEFCDHCYADSGPKGTHGTMTVRDWLNVIDQLADVGTLDVQFIGGEPTLYPSLPVLIKHAHGRGLGVEVFSNMTHIRPELWDAFQEYGVKLATSYYSDSAEEHDAVTQLRGAHKKTRANVQRALELGIPLRGGVVAVRDGQRVQEAAQDLTALGVGTVGGDRTRAFGRASQGAAPTIADLCGHCAHEKCAIGPTGEVWPCVLGRFLPLGNVLEKPISDIWGGAQMTDVAADIAAVHGDGIQSCTPPQFLPMCGPCGPCVPSVGHCDPKEAESAATIAAPAQSAEYQGARTWTITGTTSARGGGKAGATPFGGARTNGSPSLGTSGTRRTSSGRNSRCVSLVNRRNAGGRLNSTSSPGPLTSRPCPII